MSDLLYVATRKGLFTFRRDTAAATTGSSPGWRITEVDFIGDPVQTLLPDGDTLYAGLDLGHFGNKLHRRRDGAWTEVGVPTFPEQPATPEGETPDVKWSLDLLWTLERGGDGTLWAGTVPGGLFRSADHGDSWQLVRSLWDRPERREWFGGGKDTPGIHSISVDPRDSARVLVAISCGGVWATEDSGQTWTLRADGMFGDYLPPDRSRDPNVQDPHRLVRCPADPDTLWVQHHNGVFVSTDESHNWRSLTPPVSVFGFPVVVHPRDPQTAWLVPAVKDDCRLPVDGAVVVNRTRDGGATWETQREGLPQTHAYDLVYRHALDIDDTGDTLAFGSTTGSLWTTDDGGDHWHCVSTHLPPVYAVRFA